MDFFIIFLVFRFASCFGVVCDSESFEGRESAREREKTSKFCFPRRIAGIKITHSSSTTKIVSATTIICRIFHLKYESVLQVLMEFKAESLGWAWWSHEDFHRFSSVARSLYTKSHFAYATDRTVSIERNDEQIDIEWGRSRGLGYQRT